MGPCWKSRVWENLGWHYEVTNGPISLCESDGKYRALISDDPNKAGYGSGLWANTKQTYSKDPKKAVRIAIEHMQRVLSEYNKVGEAAIKAAS